MDNTKRKGAISVTITYICWGLLTVFWNLLAEVNSAYVLAQRVVWSMLFMLGYLAVTGRWGDIRQVFADKKTMICCMVSGVLVCVNWGVYIFAINSGHVLDASLGYFLEPIFVTAIGVFYFMKNEPFRADDSTVFHYRCRLSHGRLPHGSGNGNGHRFKFCFLRGSEEKCASGCRTFPVCRDLICNSDRAAVLCLQRNERTRKSGSSSWNAVFTVSNGRCDHIRSIAVI